MVINSLSRRAVILVLVSLVFASAQLAGCGTSGPTMPENLIVNAVSNSAIDVSWDASSDYGHIDGYRVYRNGELYMKTDDTGFRDSGLRNATTYCYSLRAFDGEDNRSDKTDEECDTTFASALVSMNLIANVVGTDSIDLFWTRSAVSDITRYDIHRDSVLIANTTDPDALTYSDTGLSNTLDYCYQVTAVDASAAILDSSSTVCVLAPW